MINHSKNDRYINEFWDKYITPTLIDYIKIPNKSPDFDPDWLKNGHMSKVLKLASDWAENISQREALFISSKKMTEHH